MVPVPHKGLQHREVDTRAIVRLAGVRHPEGVHANRTEELHRGPGFLHFGTVVVEQVAGGQFVLHRHHRACGVLAGATALAGERPVVVNAKFPDHVGPDLRRIARDHLDERSVLAPVGALLAVHVVRAAILIGGRRAGKLVARASAVKHRARVTL